MARPKVPMKKLAAEMADKLVASALRRRKWTPADSKAWDRAFNALKTLAS